VAHACRLTTGSSSFSICLIKINKRRLASIFSAVCHVAQWQRHPMPRSPFIFVCLIYYLLFLNYSSALTLYLKQYVEILPTAPYYIYPLRRGSPIQSFLPSARSSASNPSSSDHLLLLLSVEVAKPSSCDAPASCSGNLPLVLGFCFIRLWLRTPLCCYLKCFDDLLPLVHLVAVIADSACRFAL
jgi:hypothetical protein